jgi:hypothetical protein
MVEDTRLKIIASRFFEWYYVHTKFHENLPSGSKVISGEHTYTGRQTGYFISLLSFVDK